MDIFGQMRQGYNNQDIFGQMRNKASNLFRNFPTSSRYYNESQPIIPNLNLPNESQPIIPTMGKSLSKESPPLIPAGTPSWLQNIKYPMPTIAGGTMNNFEGIAKSIPAIGMQGSRMANNWGSNPIIMNILEKLRGMLDS